MAALSVKRTAPVLLVLLASALLAERPRPRVDPLRVCADPYDLPFSNDREEGFENKVAQIVAKDLGTSVSNFWWPHRRGFIRNSLSAGLCDVIIGVPVGFDPVRTTAPYYRSTYYFVYRSERNFNIRSLDDTVLKHLKIGVNLIGYDYTNTPPAHALSARGVVGNLIGFYNFLGPERDHPEDIVNAVAKDSVDVAIVWGPLAGYWAKRQPVPLTLVALPDSDPVSGMIFGFDMAMGVRHRDKDLAARLDSVLSRDRQQITDVLKSFNIPIAEPRAPTPTPTPRSGGPSVDFALLESPIAFADPTTRDSLLVSDDEYQGWKWFHVYCYRCHGTDAFGGQLAPDLRHSVGPEGTVTHDVFMQTVTEGRVPKGMPSWKTLLDSAQIEQVYAYVKARSSGRLAPGRPHRASDLPRP
ncbi:MAG TPA: quinoprotein dehydrogenase-associated putative ABC transporter substrate-binding protein [Gemmatimonadales bacterium]|nr:quinoprotein dehydrogenase-associated putative ABC transporter substrate-binding protein [Gemmatimonadales bacterium]